MDFAHSDVSLNSATVSGDPVFTNKISFNAGFKTANSVTSNFGSYNTINADHTYIDFNQSDIHVNQATFTGIPTLVSGLKTADSISTAFGRYNTVSCDQYSKVDIKNNSTVLCDHAYIDLSSSEMKFNSSTITGNPTFTGSPTFDNGISTSTVFIPSSTYDTIMAEFATASGS